jgi:hypothetical protein
MRDNRESLTISKRERFALITMLVYILVLGLLHNIDYIAIVAAPFVLIYPGVIMIIAGRRPFFYGLLSINLFLAYMYVFYPTDHRPWDYEKVVMMLVSYMFYNIFVLCCCAALDSLYESDKPKEKEDVKID